MKTENLIVFVDFICRTKYGKINGAIAKACEWVGCNKNNFMPPNYLKDLNAMHEAEKTLNANQKAEYALLLCHDAFNNILVVANAIHATAAQRAEMFLKVKGLWKDL